MHRCLSCNGVMAKHEKICFSCGQKNGQAVAGPNNIGFHTLVSVFFYICLVMIGVSIFTSFGPKLSLVVPVAVILLFVKSSADQQNQSQAPRAVQFPKCRPRVHHRWSSARRALAAR